MQAMSRSLKEQVTYNTQGVTSIDWQTYPIVRFSEVPQIDIKLVNRIHEPIAGAGEAATTVIAPAINNAIFDATGVRLREIPFTRDRIKAALRVAVSRSTSGPNASCWAAYSRCLALGPRFSVKSS